MLKIGVSQIRNCVDIDENFQTILKCLNLFKANRPDVVLFPECALSGFSSKILESTRDVLQNYLDQISNWSNENNVAVFLPTALKSDVIYNTGFFFQNNTVEQFYKIGLTESEKQFFSIPLTTSPKVFNVNGYRIGVLICFEAEMDPYNFFDKDSVDLILWPGYWGWAKGDQWSPTKANGEENKIFSNMTKWKVPLIQSNFAFNDLADHRGSGPLGMSMFVNKDNRLVGQGEFEKESCYLISIDKAHGITEVLGID